jgi:hypothetical protein
MKSVKVNEVTDQVRGVLRYGPYIMAVDNKTGFTFLAEPNDNLIYINTLATDPEETGYHGEPHLTAWYKHEGYPSPSVVLLKPVSEMTFDGHPYMLVSLKFAAEKK